VGIVSALAAFITWYVRTVRALDRSVIQATEQRASQVEELSSYKAIQSAPRVTPNFLMKPYSPELLQQARPDSLLGKLAQNPVPGPGSLLNPPLGPVDPNSLLGQATRPKSDIQVSEAAPATPTASTADRPPEPPKKKFDPAAEKKANILLNRARRHEKDGKVRLATKVYQEILEKYPDTEAAKIAEQHATKFVDSRADKAQEQLVRGQQWEKLNNFPEAKAEYEAIISRYPETEQAKTAKERLEALGKKAKR
jgi:tetratricopeptide (TPR) repeat protein